MGLIHDLKNRSGGYSHVQKLVRDVTADCADTPKGSQMCQIANITFDSSQVKPTMDILYQRMNDKGKHWRHCVKSLGLLRFLLCYGSTDVVEWYKENTLLVQSLCNFQREGNDSEKISNSIRTSAREIIELVQNKPKFDHARQVAAKKLAKHNNKAKAEIEQRRRKTDKELPIADTEASTALI